MLYGFSSYCFIKNWNLMNVEKTNKSQGQYLSPKARFFRRNKYVTYKSDIVFARKFLHLLILFSTESMD